MGVGIVNKTIDPFWSPIIEAVKEFFRYFVFGVLVDVVLAVVPVIQSGINTQTGTVMVNWAMVWTVALAVVLTAVLRAADKWKHENGKLENPTDAGQPKGILPF